ncbi:hypothetical protein B0T17DRAFT_93298, partial [Bombardia bombarda]
HTPPSGRVPGLGLSCLSTDPRALPDSFLFRRWTFKLVKPVPHVRCQAQRRLPWGPKYLKPPAALGFLSTAYPQEPQKTLSSSILCSSPSKLFNPPPLGPHSTIIHHLRLSWSPSDSPTTCLAYLVNHYQTTHTQPTSSALSSLPLHSKEPQYSHTTIRPQFSSIPKQKWPSRNISRSSTTAARSAARQLISAPMTTAL